jgi:hypothetical protein
MSKSLVAIFLIYCGAGIAWLILGTTLINRTQESDASQSGRLSAQWGSAQAQGAPAVDASVRSSPVKISPSASRIDVHLNLKRRRKGLLWYSLYDVQFSGRYLIRNDSASRKLTFRFALPPDGGTFSNFSCRVGLRNCSGAMSDAGVVPFELAPGKSLWIEVGYASRGRDEWVYKLGNGVASVSDFQLNVSTNFDAIDFPAQTLLPTTETRTSDGWQLAWNYSRLLTTNAIGVTIPSPLQPGPLASRITFWAPVALLFYFFVLLIITKLRGIDLHPVNYFFLACAFFAFHLLFGYLVDRVSIGVAFAICSLVSIFLTISYLRLVAGWRFAAVESGLAQFVYLVLFSFALFNEGWSGLTITSGAIVTLFVTMQATARLRWDGSVSGVAVVP